MTNSSLEIWLVLAWIHVWLLCGFLKAYWFSKLNKLGYQKKKTWDSALSGTFFCLVIFFEDFWWMLCVRFTFKFKIHTKPERYRQTFSWWCFVSFKCSMRVYVDLRLSSICSLTWIINNDLSRPLAMFYMWTSRIHMALSRLPIGYMWPHWH